MTDGNQRRDSRQRLWRTILLGVFVMIVVAISIVLAVDALQTLSLTF